MGAFLHWRAAALAGAAASALLLAPAGGPATAEEGTTLNVTVPGDGGLLSISVGQATVSGEVAAGGSMQFDLGTVTVTDTNNTIRATPWTVSVRAEDLTHATETGMAIPAVDLTYLGSISGASGITLPGLTGMTAWTTGMAMDTVNTPILEPLASTGQNSVSWNAKVTVAVPSGATAGTYTGVVYHSVA